MTWNSHNRVRLDFYATPQMRDWVDREATKAGLMRSEYVRRLIQAEQDRSAQPKELVSQLL